MPPINVDNLMRELNIDQLVQVQIKLKNEIENKREDLRQMVGRRYRDVLEASNAVKRLTEIASELSILLNETKVSFSVQNNLNSGQIELTNEYKKRAIANAGRRLLLLYTLLPVIASTSDLLTRSFALCISENLQKQVQTEQHNLLLDKKDDQNIPLILSLLFNRLFKSRIELENEIVELIGFETNWNSVTTLLTAQILLNPQIDISELLQLYLDSRMKMISEILHEPDSTLLGLVRQLKDTIQCVEQTFGRGKGLNSAILFLSKNGWAPEEIKQLVEDQTLSTSQILEKEISLVNGNCVIENKFKLIKEERSVLLQQNCFKWINEICLITKDRVKAMCNHFEKVEQAVEFAVAIGQIFKTDWLTNSFIEEEAKGQFSAYSLIYKQLFGNTLLKRFYQLIDEELILFENLLHSKLCLINCKPQMPFQRGISSVKFDPQLASGISTELQELICEFCNNLLKLLKNVKKYTNVGQEDKVENLVDILAEKVLLMVERLTNFSLWKINLIKPISEGEEEKEEEALNFNFIKINLNNLKELKQKWLSIFRLFLALVQHEPSILCLCMNHNLDKIVNCNKMLHSATEQALCQFMNCIINEHFCSSSNNLYTNLIKNVSNNWYDWMEILQEPENVLLSEKVKIFVPTQISCHFYIFLIEICSELNQNSLGHLFTKNVVLHVSKQIGNLFIKILKHCANNCLPISTICVQLIFDCKTFFQMFPDKQFLEICKLIEAKMDPIEINLIQEPLLRNAKLFAQRTTMLFGQLQSEPITAFNNNNSEVQLEESYNSLVDIIPRVQNIQRLTQIPRLSKFKDINKLKEEEENNLKEKQKRLSSKSPQRFLGSEGSSSKSGQQFNNNTSSFSSFYDKISTSWFNK